MKISSLLPDGGNLNLPAVPILPEKENTMLTVRIPNDLDARRLIIQALMPRLSCGCPAYYCACVKLDGAK